MIEVEPINATSPQVNRWNLVGVLFAFLMCFIIGMIILYQYTQVMYLGNLRYSTLSLYENHLLEHHQKYNEFPVCQPTVGNGWLTVDQAVCANQYDPMLGITGGRSYEDFLSFTGKFHEARILIREGNRSPPQNIAVVLLIGFTDEEVRQIDEKVRARQFKGADGLGPLLRKSPGEMYFRFQGNAETLSPNQSLELLQNFYDGYEPLIDVHR